MALSGASETPYSTNSPFSPETVPPEGLIHCPKCGSSFKRDNDYIRHAEEKCEAVKEWSCAQVEPGCNDVFKRRYRFRAHHKQKHACSGQECVHEKAAERALPEKTIRVCGFCGDPFGSDARKFLNHVIWHYREKRASADQWSATKVIQRLLLQVHVWKVWEKLCEERLGLLPSGWPELTWTVSNAMRCIEELEYSTSTQEPRELQATLETLLQARTKSLTE